MTANENALNWFEIPVSDIGRARQFYETIFSISMPQQDMMGMQMAYFPGEGMNGKVSGALVQSPNHQPAGHGVRIYLNGNPDLNQVLAKVDIAGGKLTMPKTRITDEIGFMAYFIDSEGNAMAIHSNK